MSRRSATDLCGVLAVDKPAGMTSHDVVAAVRRVSGEGRVGHAGTLDPMATGLLVVLIGPATRLAPYLTAARKSYDARITFGAATDTDDADGQVTERCVVPPAVTDKQFASAMLSRLPGTHLQMPPAFSAIKKDGVPAYSVARKGGEVVLEEREITVDVATLSRIEPGPPPSWECSFTVSKGTYIRALARDLGRESACCAHLSALRRTASGTLAVASAHTLTSLPNDRAALRCLFSDPLDALDFPALHIAGQAVAHVIVGRTLVAEEVGATELPDGPCAVVAGGLVLGIYQKAGSRLRPAAIMPPATRLETAR
ncbi:MAG: tRNA pseudouridine(55) synthase TruB [Coriobacteriia bacterium]|nr:tRNA pseudouridine(55) synthase TruB [Coriobacteriia bacterium]